MINQSPTNQQCGVGSSHTDPTSACIKDDVVCTPIAGSQRMSAKDDHITDLASDISPPSGRSASKASSDSLDGSDSLILPNQEAWSRQRNQRRREGRNHKCAAEQQTAVKYSITLITDLMSKLDT